MPQKIVQYIVKNNINKCLKFVYQLKKLGIRPILLAMKTRAHRYTYISIPRY